MQWCLYRQATYIQRGAVFWNLHQKQQKNIPICSLVLFLWNEVLPRLWMQNNACRISFEILCAWPEVDRLYHSCRPSCRSVILGHWLNSWDCHYFAIRVRRARKKKKKFRGSLLTKKFFLICSYRAHALHEYFVCNTFCFLQSLSDKIWMHVLRSEYLREWSWFNDKRRFYLCGYRLA